MSIPTLTARRLFLAHRAAHRRALTTSRVGGVPGVSKSPLRVRWRAVAEVLGVVLLALLIIGILTAVWYDWMT